MTKIEQFSHIGYKQLGTQVAMNEDRVIAHEEERVYAVIDGATSTTGVEIDGLTDGAYIAEFFKKEIMKGGFVTMTAQAILSEINEKFGQHLEDDHPEVAKLGKLGPSASGIVVKVHRNGTFSFAQIGDCMLVEVTQENGFIELTEDTRFDDDLTYLNKALELSKKEDKTTFEVKNNDIIKQAINAHRMMSNVKKGVITGEAEVDNFITAGVRDLENAKALILMSDGMAHPDFGKEETYIQAAKHMYKNSIENYYQHIKSLFDGDKDGKNLKYLRCKHMDDASAMVIHL